jgi:peptidoglycan/xylan/chitin deacetylase (PgdA/CDA1 family)
VPAGAWKRARLSARDGVGRVLLSAGLTHPSRCARGLLTVVTLHRVLPAEAIASYPLPQLAVTPDELAWIAGFLAEHYTCETLAEAHRRLRAGDRPRRPLLTLTFDDGQRDNWDHGRAALERAGVRATFFVPVDAVDANAPLWHDRMGFAVLGLLRGGRGPALRLLAEVGLDGEGPADDDRAVAARAIRSSKRLSGEERRALVERLEQAAGGPSRPAWDGLMSWDELRALSRAGHEVGSHTLSHPLLPGVDAAQLEREVAGSRDRIRSELGAPCESFCYPNGDQDAPVVEAVRRAGYRQAVVTAWGQNGPDADPLRLRRCELQGATSRDRDGRLSEAVVALRLSPWFARLRG